MNKFVLALSLLAVSSSLFAATACEQLKSEIDAKIKAKGVASYTLEVVDASATTDGKVVGTCEAGQKKIVYKRT